MTLDLLLRRKWTLRAGDRQVVLIKKPYESTEHVVMKALLWALYLPDYPDLTVEVGVGDRYKPDVVALDSHPPPRTDHRHRDGCRSPSQPASAHGPAQLPRQQRGTFHR